MVEFTGYVLVCAGRFCVSLFVRMSINLISRRRRFVVGVLLSFSHEKARQELRRAGVS
jgi:hypothetical protein